MGVFSIFRKIFPGSAAEIGLDTDPETAYDLWSARYDNQPDNLMLLLDGEIFGNLLNKIPARNAVIVDIGCGTGRHWKRILENNPKSLTGYDVSEGMLQKLRKKFPAAITYKPVGNLLPQLETGSCDVIVSTLTIAHIENLQEALHEWNRILRKGGHMIITDFHPDALAKGGKRTFKQGVVLKSIKNYIHPLDELMRTTAQMRLKTVELKERFIDESVKHFYEKQNAKAVFEKFKGTPIIFGLLLNKSDDLS